jgi:hypothetical protein
MSGHAESKFNKIQTVGMPLSRTQRSATCLYGIRPAWPYTTLPAWDNPRRKKVRFRAEIELFDVLAGLGTLICFRDKQTQRSAPSSAVSCFWQLSKDVVFS